MNKISVRLWILMLGLIFMMIGLLWFFQIRFLTAFYLESQTKNIMKQGHELTELLLTDVDGQKIKDKLEELNLKYNAGIDIYTQSGNLQYSSDQYAQLMLGINKAALITETLQKKEVLKVVTHSRLGYQEVLAGISIIDKNNKVKGVILLMAPLAPVQETVGILKQQLVYITAILVIFSFVLAYFFSKAFTKPILLLKNGAKEMAKGNLDIRFNIKNKDELGDLAETMNDLSGQLKKIEQMRKDLIANVSHEFRTPLSLIYGYAETVRDITGSNPDKRTKQLNVIMEESERLSEMVSDMLDYSSLQSNSAGFDIREIDLEETMLAVTNRFDYFRQKTNIDLVTDIPDMNVFVMADEKRISQVFYNLINNAFVHSGSSLPIIARIKPIGDKYRVEIENRGKIIPSEEIEYIWERFHKLDRQRNSGGGSGLGLAIVKTILDAHKSTYGVYSNEEDGTVFWFELEKANLPQKIWQLEKKKEQK